MNWYHLSINKSFESTGSSINGLTSGNAASKLQKEGLNELQFKKKISALKIFLHQFKDFMVLILLFAAIISGLVGDMTDTIIILILVILNAFIGFFQEYSAEKAMDALNKMATTISLVIRDGQTKSIPATGLVVGDIVLLEAGNIVPADVRLIESNSLRIDESALTGESVAVDKGSNELKEENIPLGDQINMGFKGTLITNGKGKALIVGTGMNTEIGKIAKLLQQNELVTPLQKRMTDFGKKLSFGVLGICALLFIIGILRGEEVISMLLLSISLAVAAIPEALPALITIALASGAKRLVKENALIRKLPAVETLGSVTYICSDKTGTLTMNKMEVVQVHEEIKTFKNFTVSPLYMAMILNHDIKSTGENKLVGDPTEIAFIAYCKNKLGENSCNEIIAKLPKVGEIPFSADRKCMTTIHKFDEKYILFSKGAIESISKNLSSEQNKDTITSKNNEWAKQGIRVLAFAFKIMDVIPESLQHESLEKDLILGGVVGLIDPPRKEVKAAISECRSAGIKPVMITGDHLETAIAIAKDIGIMEKNSTAITGSELQALSATEFENKVEHISVYARVSPEQKINIVRALQSRGQVVSMTGDGVNDAPSLKAANIGIAMGITGTDVSKEAAHMILLDDNFATIVKAVKEGRRIYDNIRKFVKYILTCNSAEIWLIVLAPFFGLPIPLLPIHILWINLATDGLPGLALTSEEAEPDIMKKKPKKSNESLFADGIIYHVLWVGLLMAGISLAAEAWAIQNNKSNWQTMVFTVLALSQLGHVLTIRSDKMVLLKKNMVANIPLFTTVLLTGALQLTIIYLPVANSLLKTRPLSFTELMICVALSSIIFLISELEKWLRAKIKK